MQHKISLSVTQSESGSGSGPSVSGTTYKTGSVAASVDQTFGIVTNSVLPMAWTVANTQSLAMLSTKDMTIKVNSSGSPTSTISLKAGSPLLWSADDGYFTNPFSGTTTVANLYITTAASARLSVLVISN